MKEILVVDDDYYTSYQIKELLSDIPYQLIITASSLNDALGKIKIRIPDGVIFNRSKDIQINNSVLSVITDEYHIPIICINEKSSPNSNELFITSELTEISKPIEKAKLLNALKYFNFDEKTTSELLIVKAKTISESIVSEVGETALNFIRKFTDFSDDRTVIVSTTSRFNIKVYPVGVYHTLANLEKINDIKHLNKFFETANDLLLQGGIFIGCAETKGLRKKRILKKFPPILNYIYYTLDFILKRVFPKLSFTKKIYFFITKGKNRVLSRAEILGRLYSCGFEVVDEQFINNLLFFAVKKVKKPVYDYHPTYGLLVRMNRVGKNGKLIGVYKFRTMHPYSEYLQEYIYKVNLLDEGGKFKNDFRVTTLGKFMRKFWIDELPMIYNVLKGDLKLFGVRPLSNHYFSLYPKDFQNTRIKYKPGLVPPFYKDMPKTLDEVVNSEMEYIRQYDKHPLTTDFKYFFLAWHNILFKKARSK